MIVSAAVVPGPPLLCPELGVGDPTADELRAACVGAVAQATAIAPDVVAVVGTADVSAVWPSGTSADFAAYGACLTRPAQPAPLAIGVGCLLLELAGHKGELDIRSIAATSTQDECRFLAQTIAQSAERVALVVVADGTARRTLKAPGYLDARAEGYDGAVERAVSSGDLEALHALDPALAAELMASGWAPLQVLAFALGSGRATVHYSGAPFGVGYLAASILPA